MKSFPISQILLFASCLSLPLAGQSTEIPPDFEPPPPPIFNPPPPPGEPALLAIELVDLVRPYTGFAPDGLIVTNPAGVELTISHDGKPGLPVLPGSYLLSVRSADPAFQGTGSGSLTIQAPPAATIAAQMRGIFDWLLTLAQGTERANADLEAALELFESSGGDWGKVLSFAFAARPLDHPQEQVIRLYLAFFNRLPDSKGLAFWTDQLAARGDIMALAEEFVTSAEFEGKFGNPSNEDFVKLVYQNTLMRQPDSEGLAHWSGSLDGGASRARLMWDFAKSEEFAVVRRAEVVVPRTLLNLFGSDADATLVEWTTYLQENPVEGGEAAFFANIASMDIFEEMLPDQRPADTAAFANALSSRLLARPLSDDELANVELAVRANVLSHAEWTASVLESEEFLARMGPVFRLYQAYFLRYPETGGLEFWSGAFASSSATLGYGPALASISEQFVLSDEFVATYGDLDNLGFVKLIYSNVLRRQPDSEGLAFWKGMLDNGTTKAALMVSFCDSDEYRLILANEQMAYFAGIFLSEVPDGLPPGAIKRWAAYFNNGGDPSELVHELLANAQWAGGW